MTRTTVGDVPASTIRKIRDVSMLSARKRIRAERTLSYSFPDVLAECIVDLQGFREGVAGQWLVTRAEHYVGPNGYRCTIEAEMPNSAPRVSEVQDTTIEDRVQEPIAIED